MLDRVSKAAGKLCDELAALDDQGRAQVGFWAVTRGDLEGKIRTPEAAVVIEHEDANSHG
jgi:hypothetical protein